MYRADLEVFDGNAEDKNDVAVINPLCPSYQNDEDPVEHYEKLKQKHYGRMSPTAKPVIPFIFDCFGRCGEHGMTILEKLKKVAKKEGRRFSFRFRVSSLSVALQHGNGKCSSSYAKKL